MHSYFHETLYLLFSHFFEIFQDPDGEGEEGDEDEEGGEDGVPEDPTLYEYRPPESKPWETQGSLPEVQDLSVIPSRGLVSLVKLIGYVT